MNVQAYKLSSFAKSSNGGNPAGVVLEADCLSEAQMISLAARIGFSETAFISRSEIADFKVRFFTPTVEIDLCGHATIAAFSLMKQKGIIKQGKYTQETKAGVLRINISEDSVFMEQAKPVFTEIIAAKELEDCLGIESGDFDIKMPIQIVSTGVRDILVPVKNQEVLEALKPNMPKIEEISIKYNVTGLHVFTIDCSLDSAICRNFAPLYGIPEESATGTSNGALASYLYQYHILNAPIDDICIEQGSFMDRPSRIRASLKVQGEEIQEVWVGGDALIIGEESYTLY